MHYVDRAVRQLGNDYPRNMTSSLHCSYRGYSFSKLLISWST